MYQCMQYLPFVLQKRRYENARVAKALTNCTIAEPDTNCTIAEPDLRRDRTLICTDTLFAIVTNIKVSSTLRYRTRHALWSSNYTQCAFSVLFLLYASYHYCYSFLGTSMDS